MTEEPAQPEKQLTPETERVLQNSISAIREIRAPVNSMIGFSAIMLEREGQIGSLNEKQREYLTYIYESGKSLLEILNFLLDIDRLIFDYLSLSIEEVDLRKLIQQVIPTVKVKVEQNLPHHLPKIWADQGRIQQVLKWILWETQGENYLGEADSILLTLNGNDDWITFNISASGREQLFYFDDPNRPTFFFSRSIIEMHGGQMQVNVQKELKQLEISFTLPIQQNKPYSE